VHVDSCRISAFLGERARRRWTQDTDVTAEVEFLTQLKVHLSSGVHTAAHLFESLQLMHESLVRRHVRPGEELRSTRILRKKTSLARSCMHA
jgi:hypothetical protein